MQTICWQCKCNCDAILLNADKQLRQEFPVKPFIASTEVKQQYNTRLAELCRHIDTASPCPGVNGKHSNMLRVAWPTYH